MVSYFSKKNRFRKASATSLLALSTLVLGSATLSNPAAFGQATAINGSIQGTVTDPSGAVVSNAAVTITNTGTGVTREANTNGSGFYTSGPLIPGNYSVKVVAPGFSQTEIATIVQINVATSGNVKLQVGNSGETIQVDAGAVQVQETQSNVQDVITQQQIQTLPINGRNFLDLAQLEPGVQLQDGGDFDPTKAGYSGLSFSGTSGRTTRILMDGQDITDETVGTTIVNVSEGAIGQFQIVRSTADVGNDLGSTGQVIVATNSGTNGIHGNLLYNFQDQDAGFASNQGFVSPFQRNQFGGAVGGPIIKDKLFFFANSERIKQDAASPSGIGAPFTALGAAYPNVPSPFRDTYSTGRLDWNGPWNVHYFARVFYEANAATTNGQAAYQNYVNRDNTPGIAGGADFVTGHFTHSIRGSYEKFHNMIADASAGVGPSGSVLPAGLGIQYGAANFFVGPNPNAPQQTFQSDKQLRYDGSWTHGSHSVRYGAELNRILGGGFASFYGAGPLAVISSQTLVGPSSGSVNPLNYSPTALVLGNGLGASTEIPEFGLAGGGQGDWRVGAYLADSWKVTPRFTLNAGLRYQRDTGRTDADLAPTPCSAIDPTFVAPCSGNTPLLDEFAPGLGDRVTQPNFSFGPQLGFAYSADASGKTIIRASVGRFFENSVFNNVLFDRPAKLATGSLFSDAEICTGGNNGLPTPKGTITSVNGVSLNTLCTQPLSQSSTNLIALEKEYQAAFAGASLANPAFVGNSLSIGPAGQTVFSPNYKTPTSLQVNLGVQRELFTGGVLSVDYVHSATIHIGQVIDVNHVGAARYFNKAAAQAAVAATLAKCDVASVDEALLSCPGIEGVGTGATIVDFANQGLDSGNNVLQGNSPQAQLGAGATNPSAFPGANPVLGQGLVQYPGGRSGYDGLQFNFREQVRSPLPGISESNLEVSYAYSKFVSDIGANSTGNNSDVFFNGQAYDYDQPSRFNGFGGLDHRHNISFGGSATLKYGPQISLIGHLLSSAPVNLTLDNVNPVAQGQIFTTDWTGDGKVGDLVQGTNPGAYMRSVKGSGLNKLINTYNGTYANTATPAGQQLLNNGIFTGSQLQRLGAVQQPIAAAPTNPFSNPMFRQVDASALYPIHLKFLGEGRSLEPGVAVYNVANFGNYTLPTSFGALTADGEPNFVNGPYNFGIKNPDRVTRGSGTYAAGTPRSMEWQLKFVF